MAYTKERRGGSMILYKEVMPKHETSNYPRRYLLIQGVTDEDARILEMCNMVRKDELDIEVDGETCEAWMVM